MKIPGISLQWLRVAAALLTSAAMPPAPAAATPARAPDGPAQAAVFSIVWDPGCATPPAAAETALDYAAGLWGARLASPVSVTVSACWTDSLPCAGIACGDTTTYARNFPGAPLVDTYYPIALANALNGRDLAPDGRDITVYFLSTVNWSFTTDTPPTTPFDFVTAALHELGHGLGFSGNMYESYNVGFCGNGPYYWYACPTPYDRLAVDSLGVPLLSYMEPDPRVLGSKLKSDANFGGPNAVLRNGGAWVKLYTPTLWDQGTSLSHLDTAWSSTGDDALMCPSLPSRLRDIGPVTLGIMQDMGWQAAGDAPNLTIAAPVVRGVNAPISFTASLLWPAYAGQPVTYTWSADDLAPVTHTGQLGQDGVLLTWNTPGVKRVTVTATNIVTPVAAIRTVRVAHLVYLPLIQKEF